jgi:DNA-directed RNA polymerase subunit RPC12/RpoP
MKSTIMCIGCGTSFPLANRYRGNYCTDCHESWLARPKSAGGNTRAPRVPRRNRRPRPTRTRTGSDE